MMFIVLNSSAPLRTLWNCVLLPIIGFIHSTFVVSLALLFQIIPIVILAFVFVPKHLWDIYHTIITTPHWGRNLKCLAVCLLPIPLVMFLLLCCFGSISVAIERAINVRSHNMRNKYRISPHWVGGTRNAFRDAFANVEDFYRFNAHNWEYHRFLNDLKTPLSPTVGSLNGRMSERRPLDIRFVDIFLFAAVNALAMVIDVPLTAALALLFFIPLCVGGWVALVKEVASQLNLKSLSASIFFIVGCLPFNIAAFLLIPIGIGCLLCIVIISSFFVGLYAAVATFDEKVKRCVSGDALRLIWQWVDRVWVKLYQCTLYLCGVTDKKHPPQIWDDDMVTATEVMRTKLHRFIHPSILRH